jgi:hypothetical protein
MMSGSWLNSYLGVAVFGFNTKIRIQGDDAFDIQAT